MIMSYDFHGSALILAFLIGAFSYIGFVIKSVWLWRSYSKPEKDDSFKHIVLLSLLFAFSEFASLGMILPALRYPR
ncbi:MAG: hypothetical protein AAGC65_24955 [Mucilaginibacter sp.]|uniref:hypothetical protein n=1 Tax=Mucilaginibacter sp. TaxID=1882438 RepID=UPI0031A76510